MADYYTYHRRVVTRKRRRRAVIALLVVLALLCATAGTVLWIHGQQEPADPFAGQPVFSDSTPQSDPISTPAQPTSAPVSGYSPQRLLPQVDTAAWDTATPVAATNDDGYYNTDFRMVALPELGTVDDSFFNTVTFVGDSISSGLGIYATGLPRAKYAAYKGASARSFVYNTSMENAVTHVTETPFEAIAATQPDYLYIMCGTNDLVNPSGEENFLTFYERMIDTLREQLPGVIFYVQAIPGVQEDVVKLRPGLYAERIETVNNMLANLALRKGCYFINTQEALSNKDGSMIDEYDAGLDGIHFNPTGYRAWADYLRTHTAWNHRSVYIGYSPYYIYGR